MLATTKAVGTRRWMVVLVTGSSVRGNSILGEKDRVPIPPGAVAAGGGCGMGLLRRNFLGQ